MATFTGRWDPTKLPEIRSSTKGDKVTVRWSTDDYDENAIGDLEEVGFSATASSTTAGVNSNCADGQSGASCEYDYCLGVVTKQASGSWESIRSQLSEPGFVRAELALRLAHRGVVDLRRAQVHGARDRERLRLRQDLRGWHRADGLFAHGSGDGTEAALRGDGLDAALAINFSRAASS